MSRIKTKSSTTPGSVPASGSLLIGELAVNITDRRLFIGNGSGNPAEITNQGVASIVSNTSGIYLSQSTGSVTVGFGPNIFVSGSLSASGLVDGDQSAINVYAAEGTGGYSQWMKFKDYAGYYSKIMGSDDGAMYFQNQANAWNFVPSGAAAESVSLDTTALTGYLFNSASVVQIGNPSTTIILNSTGVIATGDLRANHFIGDLIGAVVKDCKYTGTGTIRRGNPMYITGTVGSTYVIEVQTAQANDINKLSAIGLSEQALAANATGHVILNGSLRDLDTSAFTVGDLLYVGATGWMTNIRPTGATQFVQPIGRVARSHSTQGEIIVTALSNEQHNPNTIAASGTLILGTPDIVTALVGTASVFNTNAARVNIGGGASGVQIGNATGVVTVGDIAVNNGAITTTAATATLFNTTASRVNIGAGASGVQIGNATGVVTVGDLAVNDGTISTTSTACDIFNTTAVRINIGAGASGVKIGNATGVVTVGDLAVNDGTISTTSTACDIFNATAARINIGAGASGVKIGNATGVVVVGDVAVNNGAITTTAATASLFNATASRVNIGAGASGVQIGHPTGTVVMGNISATGHISAASGYRIASAAINAQTATGYTLAATDNGRIITFESAATHTLRIPTGLDIGFNATIIQLGTGQVTCTGLAGATVNCYASGNKILGQHGSASVLCYASNVYNLAGTLGI